MGPEDADQDMETSSSSESSESGSESTHSSQATNSPLHEDEAEVPDGVDEPSTAMLVDEAEATSKSQANNELNADAKAAASANGTDGSQTNTTEANKKGSNALKKAQKRRSRALKRAFLLCPDKIVENVLSKSQFKVPNLSQLVEEKFNAPDFQLNLADELKDIKYNDSTSWLANIDRSVLPSKFDKTCKVNIAPSAITMLRCMYDIPPRRDRRGRGPKRGGGSGGGGGRGGGGSGSGNGGGGGLGGNARARDDAPGGYGSRGRYAGPHHMHRGRDRGRGAGPANGEFRQSDQPHSSSRFVHNSNHPRYTPYDRR